jgi:polyvinyl alcohol dehydrogenase (cytochrome)
VEREQGMSLGARKILHKRWLFLVWLLPLSLVSVIALGQPPDAGVESAPPGEAAIPHDSISTIVERRGDGDGAEATFRTHCATCHMGNSGKTRAPSVWHLSSMSPRAVLSALEVGKMREQGSALDSQEKARLVSWLTGAQPQAQDIPATAYCTKPPAESSLVVQSAGWGGNLNADGYRPVESGGLHAGNVEQLALQWVFAVPGGSEMRSKPAVVGSYLIFGTQFGTVFALDKHSGCVRWMYEAGLAVRGAINVAPVGEGKAVAYFADMRGTVHAVDVVSGTLLWKSSAASHYLASVTGSVAYHEGQLFIPFSSSEILSTTDSDYPCCSTSGEVVSVSASSGEVLWRYRVIRKPATAAGRNSAGEVSYGPSGAPVWSSPTVDARRGVIYVGTGENFTRPATNSSDSILALDMKSGKLAWSYQGTAGDVWNLDCFDDEDAHCPEPGPDVDFGMAPMLVTRPDGKEILVVGQKSGYVHALDPDDGGQLLWRTRAGRGGALGGIHWGMAVDATQAYAPLADYPAWVVVDVQPTMPSSPGVAALDLMTGKVVWRHHNPAPACGDSDMSCLRANSAALTAVPGAVFTGSMDGIMRALSTKTGEIIWDFDTAGTYEAINGIKAHGGSIEGPGPVVADGKLYVLSGYTTNTGNAGNALFAFAVDAATSSGEVSAGR